MVRINFLKNELNSYLLRKYCIFIEWFVVHYYIWAVYQITGCFSEFFHMKVKKYRKSQHFFISFIDHSQFCNSSFYTMVRIYLCTIFKFQDFNLF